MTIIWQLYTQVSTGAMDDIRRATDVAYRSVSEYGLSAAVGPLSVASLAAGGGDDGILLSRESGTWPSTSFA